jgi:hypothetical protein
LWFVSQSYQSCFEVLWMIYAYQAFYIHLQRRILKRFILIEVLLFLKIFYFLQGTLISTIEEIINLNN